MALRRGLFHSLVLAASLGAWVVAHSSSASNDSATKVEAPATATEVAIERFDQGYRYSEPHKRPEGGADYEILRDGKQFFLRGHYLAGTSGTVVYRRLEWDTEKFPWLEWRWRVMKHPTGAKILEDGKGDAAANVYVSWKVNGRSYALKYVWAAEDPVGTHEHFGRFNPVGRNFLDVIRSGLPTGQWQKERRNVREDFKKAFNKDAPTWSAGLGFMTDGDDTHSDSMADFADFVAKVR